MEEFKPTNWIEAVAAIVKVRKEYATRVLRDAELKSDQANAAVGVAERAVDTQKMRFGKKSGNRKLQQAQSAIPNANRAAKAAQLAYEAACIAAKDVDSDHELLVEAVERYLLDRTILRVCDSIVLQVDAKNDSLNIYFRRDDKKPLEDKRSHGHFVIKPDGKADAGSTGTATYTRQHGAPHGQGNYHTTKPIFVKR